MTNFLKARIISVNRVNCLCFKAKITFFINFNIIFFSIVYCFDTSLPLYVRGKIWIYMNLTIISIWLLLFRLSLLHAGLASSHTVDEEMARNPPTLFLLHFLVTISCRCHFVPIRKWKWSKRRRWWWWVW